MSGPESAASLSWGAVRPQRVCPWEQRDGRIALLAPRFGGGRFGRLMDRWFRLRPYRLRLDGMGTFVWERLDGCRTVEEIAGEMEAAYGAGAGPVAERLPAFLGALQRGRFIEVREGREADRL